MAMPSAGNGGAVMRLVPETAAAPMEFVQPVADPVPVVLVNSLQDVLTLADTRRDVQMKVLIRSLVRPVSFRPGVIEIGLADNAPRGFASDLSRKLTEWTGQRFMVSVVPGATAKTLEETENAKRDGIMADAKADPDVAAILSRFPGAKIINVRIESAPGNADIGSDDTGFNSQPQVIDPGMDDDE